MRKRRWKGQVDSKWLSEHTEVGFKGDRLIKAHWRKGHWGVRGQGASPCRDLAVVHVGRDDDPELALAPLRTEREECWASWGPRLRAPQPFEPEVPAHLAVQYDHMLWVSTEPRLHGFADGTQLVQRGCM